MPFHFKNHVPIQSWSRGSLCSREGVTQPGTDLRVRILLVLKVIISWEHSKINHRLRTFPGSHGGVWRVDKEGYRSSRAGTCLIRDPGVARDPWGQTLCKLRDRPRGVPWHTDSHSGQGGQGWGTAPARAEHTRGQVGGVGLCGPELGGGATSSPTWTDVLVCKMQVMLFLTPKPDGSYIFSCFLKEVGLTQSHCLFSCPLDVPLQQILSLLAKFNHRRAGV